MKHAMVLAAGRGERMRPLSDDTPKPLLEVGGRALIEHHLDRLGRAGFGAVTINLSWLGAEIRERLGDGHRYGVTIRYVDEGPEPLGTAGGIVNALALLGTEPFLVVNGDVWTDFRFDRLALGTGERARIMLVPNPPHNPGGDFDLKSGSQSAIGEKLTFAGIGLYSPSLFAGVEPGKRPLAPILHAAAADGTLGLERYDGDWDDVGTPERLEALRRRVGSR